MPDAPTKGQKLYNCFDGELEVVYFDREEIQPGASVPTWRVYKNHNSNPSERPLVLGHNYYSVRPDMYCLTEREAIGRYLTMLDDTLPGLHKQQREVAEQIAHVKAEKQRIAARIVELCLDNNDDTFDEILSCQND